MSDLSRLVVPVVADSCQLVGTGGIVRKRVAYVNGERSDEPFTRNGAAVHKISSGLVISLAGIGLDGAAVETTTPLEEIVAGTIFRPEGIVELSVRAEVRPGFGDGGPRAVLIPTVFVETLTPLGSVTELLARPNRRAASES
jgi:hypothetical protein